MSTVTTPRHPQLESFAVDETALTAFADALLQATDHGDYGLSLVLTDDEEICQLNTTYRHKPQPTNVLSFPFADGGEPFLAELPVKELGDIIISLDTARGEAEEYDQTFTFRLCWLVVHGLLHLQGMDHERSAEEETEMQAREQELLTQVTPAQFGL